jgi:long-subunit fatty acid transport protein
VNLSLLENKLNVAMKYEMASKMTVKNETTVDGSGMFPDGAESNSDIPAFFSFGADYKVMDNLKLSFGTHYYWDMNVSYGKSFNGETNVKNDLVLNSNAYEFAGGFEYGLNEKLALSAGYLFTSSAPRNEYQSDLSYSLNTNSIGLGGNYKVNDNFGIDLGFLNTFYMGKDILANGVTTGYDKTAWVLSFGFTYALTK